ncbi:antitoxin [bacterium RCC_150]
MPVGLLDDLKGKAQDLIGGNEEAIKDGIDKVGDFVDDKTGGKFAGQVDAARNAASNFVGNLDNGADKA